MYDATEIELCMINEGEIGQTAKDAFIYCAIDKENYYLTIHGAVKKGSWLEKGEAYYNGKSVAEDFLKKWIESKKVVKKENNIKTRMSNTEFKLAIKNFK